MHDEWMDGCAPEVCTEMQIHVEKNTKRNLTSQDVIPPCQTAIYRNVGDLHSRRPPAPLVARAGISSSFPLGTDV